jgi:hypothetical protein
MSKWRVKQAGELSKKALVDLALPEGHMVTPSKTPVLWISDEKVEPIGETWAAVADHFKGRGLWPLALETLRDTDDRPWDSGELEPGESSDPASQQASAVLGRWWADNVPVPSERDALAALAPFGREFPGLAKPTGDAVDVELMASVADGIDARLGIVAVTRPADAPTVLGWQGPVNHFSDMGLLSCVLRSWEDRFGAVLVGMGFDTLTLAVGSPPEDNKTALAIAAEHFAVCSDIIYQGSGSIEAHAAELVGARSWTFWWD